MTRLQYVASNWIGLWPIALMQQLITGLIVILQHYKIVAIPEALVASGTVNQCWAE